MRAFSVSCTVFLTALASCSLMGLDDFDASPCVEDADCRGASEHLPPPPTKCAAYHCRDKLCVLEEGLETCNYQDDDCDGLIDEDVAVRVRKVVGEDSEHVSFAQATDLVDGTTYVAIPGAGEGWIVDRGGAVVREQLRYDSATANADLTCPLPAGPAACNFAEVALAVDSEHLVFVTVNTLGCASGQVRVGLGDRRREPYTVWLGRTQAAQASSASNLEYGVDVDDRNCTGASRQATSASSDVVRGATRPAVAALDLKPGAEGALAAWLAARTGPAEPRDACGEAASFPVEALGVFVPSAESNGPNGTDDGTPQTLGHTTSRTAPAVIAANVVGAPPGYFVAFAEEGGVRVVFAHREAARLKFDDVALIPEVMADEVSLSLGASKGTSTELAVAWTTGCGARKGLRFAVIHPFLDTAAGHAIELPATQLKSPPQLSYSAGTFATTEPRGGWFLAWAEQTSERTSDVRLARFTERTPRALSTVTVASGAFGYPILHPVEASSGYVLVRQSEAGSEVEAYPGWCDVRD